MISITADTKRFTAALRAIHAEVKKPEAEIVNRALKDVAFRAASFTPFARPSQIASKLTDNGLLPALASIALNKKMGKKQWTRADHRVEMFRILAARRRGVKALRAGWIPAIQAMGGNFRGARLVPGGSASHGTGKKATISNLFGFIRNSVRTHDAHGVQHSAREIAVAVEALNHAIEFVTADREVYLAGKRAIGAVLKKHSSK